jgi:hydrogenase expression/formation protein HypC
MCLAVPGLITKIEETMAEVDLGGISTRVSILFTPEAIVGNYVIMHAGYAISLLDTKEAEETLQLLQEIAETNADE